MRSRFHEEAERDLNEAADYYNGKSAGLGDRLVSEVRTAVTFIEQYPRAASVIDQDIRGKVLVRFPHTLLYIVGESEIIILAVAHQSQDPPRWRGTLSARRA